MKFDDIFKTTSTGATQVWRQETNEAGDIYRTVSGQIDGKKVTSEWKFAAPTNVGRSNERNSQAQAIFEIEANYKKKLESGYVRDIKDKDVKTEVIKPMLAKKYGDVELSFPLYSQPKLDGVRAIVTENGIMSRSWKPIIAVPHIFEALKPVFEKFPGIVFDGELYNHQFRDNFNEIISIVRKQKPKVEDFEKSQKYMQYWVYDLIMPDKSFQDRILLLKNEIFANHIDSKSVEFVPTNLERNLNQLNDSYSNYIENGYEGQMIRFDKPYENKRSKFLLKRKEFQSEEFSIKDIEEGVGNRAGMAGKIVYETSDGKEFRSGIKGGFEFYKKLLEDREKYIGNSVGTVEFFALTPDGIPRFPVTVAVYFGERDI